MVALAIDCLTLFSKALPFSAAVTLHGIWEPLSVASEALFTTENLALNTQWLEAQGLNAPMAQGLNAPSVQWLEALAASMAQGLDGLNGSRPQ